MPHDYTIQYSQFHPNTKEHCEAMAASLASELSQFLPVSPNPVILDLGCGFGFALLALNKLGYSDVRGIDIDRGQVDRARSFGLLAEHIVDSERYLSRNVEAFDMIIMLDVLEHVPVAQQIDLLSAARTSLKTNGRILVRVPNANSIVAARWRYDDHTHCTTFTEHSLNYVLKNAGFSVVEFVGSKGAGKSPRHWWLKRNWRGTFKWLTRWLWVQIYRSEIPWENSNEMCFDLNLLVVAYKDARK